MVTSADAQPESKAKILAAATKAFVAVGPAGARVDAIAAAAGVNKRMLYHYFGNKQALYQAVLQASAANSDVLSTERARLLAWEGLLETETPGSSELGPSLESDVEPLQEASGIQALDAQMFLLLQRALQVFPHVFGPEAERITGLAPDSEAFNAATERLADQVKRRLDPSKQVQASKTKVRLRPRSKPAQTLLS